MKRQCINLIFLLILFGSFQKILYAQTPEQMPLLIDQPMVISAVAPFYPKLYPPNIDGSVWVSVTIDAKGNVSNAQALNGPPLLRDSSIKAAKLWKFAPASGDAKDRKARLIFEYRIVPKGTPESELWPVYKPPFVIEVKRIKERYGIAW